MAVLLSRSCVLLLAAYAAWWALVTTVGMVGHTTDHGDSSPLQPADPPPRKPPTARGMPCGGMVVALTRSVVDPPRRPARLRVSDRLEGTGGGGSEKWRQAEEEGRGEGR